MPYATTHWCCFQYSGLSGWDKIFHRLSILSIPNPIIQFYLLGSGIKWNITALWIVAIYCWLYCNTYSSYHATAFYRHHNKQYLSIWIAYIDPRSLSLLSLRHSVQTMDIDGCNKVTILIWRMCGENNRATNKFFCIKGKIHAYSNVSVLHGIMCTYCYKIILWMRVRVRVYTHYWWYLDVTTFLNLFLSVLRHIHRNISMGCAKSKEV